MWMTACRIEDVPDNGMKEVAVGGVPLLIVSAGGEHFAYQAQCPHEAVPLEQGVHDGSVLTCLEHLWQFDLRTGAPLGDSESGLTAYRLRRADALLEVWIEPAAGG